MGYEWIFSRIAQKPRLLDNTFIKHSNIVNVLHLNGQTMMKHLPTVQHKVWEQDRSREGKKYVVVLVSWS